MTPGLAAAVVVFWLALAAAATARYLLCRPGWASALTLAVLATLPVLVAVAAVDLARGGTATPLHAAGPVLLGCVAGYARPVRGWADRNLSHLVAGGSPPRPPDAAGHARRLRARLRHHGLAWTCGSVALLAVWAVAPTRARALLEAAVVWAVAVVVEAVVVLLTPVPGRRA